MRWAQIQAKTQQNLNVLLRCTLVIANWIHPTSKLVIAWEGPNFVRVDGTRLHACLVVQVSPLNFGRIVVLASSIRKRVARFRKMKDDKITQSIENIRNALSPLSLDVGWLHQQVVHEERDDVKNELLNAFEAIKKETNFLETEFRFLKNEVERLQLELLSRDA